MKNNDLKQRTKEFALRVIHLRDALPKKMVADETGLWLELIGETCLLPVAQTSALHTEAEELTAIAVTSIRTARSGVSIAHSALRPPHSK